MGVHDLWSIVEPVRDSVPLFSLSGKTLAVDLSLWVCEAQHVQAMVGRVTKPHLRNLFFRVSSLTLMGVKLVFVMEGEAPQLKAETMSKRTGARYGFKKASAPVSTSRGRFRAVLRECADLLDSLGVPWVTAAGEAEAMCAYLDTRGLVDGCITNDGDAFLYGAQTVYRNFNMNSKDPQVDCYRTSRVRAELHLCRENLVGLAVLLGCDYIPKGVPGVGKEQALRLIQTLEGQTLLQRFRRWREEGPGESAGVVKKVAHCHVCRHPGSAKAHERGGCGLCDSERFCQPQDFDYRCPCDWHRREQTRQASSLEANIRKKTLASGQFPFTEIISEFLVSKEKPVSQFKRKRPNMLSMQRFAFEKMEWPKHYTSEKVLVLMTYAELMNRKHGRETSSQIKPLRILKPRVRNAVACFEIVWSPPEHFVFPEDRPAEDRGEVRTVEEESLFRVAYPELVDSFLRDKAQVEENKKKRKPKRKQEKPSDLVSDGISDLLAQMSLRGSSSSEPHTPLPAGSLASDPEVVVLDTPVNHKQPRQSKEDHEGPGDRHRRIPVQPEASPSVSAVIEALHLSDVDWDASSFTSSPRHQPELRQTTEGEGEEKEDAEQKTSKLKEAESDLSYTECPLGVRVLMRNASRAAGPTDVVAKQRLYELDSLRHNSSLQIPGNGGGLLSGKQFVIGVKEPLAEKRQRETNKTRIESYGTKAKTKCDVSRKPPQKYTFVRTASSPPAAPPSSDPGQADRNVPRVTKKSVCVSAGSCSEESDAENQRLGPRGKAKIKNQNKSRFVPDLRLKPASAPETAQAVPLPQMKPRSCRADAAVKSTSGSTETTRRDASPADLEDVFLQTPASPAASSDSDDTAVCSESPLPLAERLRLKMLKVKV